MFFSRMEDFLEKNIEGFFNSKFSSSLQMAEIEKFIDRLILRHKKQVNRAIFVPDNFIITMSEADYARLSTPETFAHLKLFLYKSVILKDYFMAKKPTIDILKSPKLKLGVCEMKAKFSDINTSNKTRRTDFANEIDKDREETQGTIIAHNMRSQFSTNNVPEPNFASLTIIAGPDKDSYLEFGTNQIHIGRREQNEFIITDLNVSRLHAYITFEHGRHILHDANSLNGTSVNGTPITGFCLCPGDKIKMGNTSIVYDII